MSSEDQQQTSKVVHTGKDYYKDDELPRSRVSRVIERVDGILRMGRIEAKGIQPIPVEERRSTRFWNIFTVWCSMNTNILG